MHYQVVRTYNDGYRTNEQALSLSNALSACSIYVEQPDITKVEIWCVNWIDESADRLFQWIKEG